MKLLVLLVLCAFAGMSSGLGFRDLLIKDGFSVVRSRGRWVNWLSKHQFLYDLDRTILLEAWLENGSGISNRNNKKRMITRKGRLRNVKNPIFESTQRSSNPIFTWLEFDSPVLLLVVIEYIHYTIVSIFWLQLR